MIMSLIITHASHIGVFMCRLSIGPWFQHLTNEGACDKSFRWVPVTYMRSLNSHLNCFSDLEGISVSVLLK